MLPASDRPPGPCRRPAVFLDRDGTLIEDRGHLRHPSEVVFFRNTIPALLRLQQKFRLFIVTHQPGIAEGILDPAEVAGVHEFMLERLGGVGIRIDHIYCCPHRRTDGCRCIKPNPYHLHRAERMYGIDLQRSFVVGDHPHDATLAVNAGATGIFVLTGHGERHLAEIPSGVSVARDIGEASTLIVEMAECPGGRQRDNAGQPDLQERRRSI